MMKTEQDTLITVEKTEGAGCLLYDVSDLTLNGGLSVVAGTPRDSLSAQIEVPQEFDENKYLSVSFQMGDGFSYKHKAAFAQLRLEGANKSAKVKMILSDTADNIIESKLYEYVNADSILLDTLPNLPKPNDVYLYERVTMKLYVYGEADYYRLCLPVTCNGEICEVLRFPEGYNFTPYMAKSEIDLDGIGLLTVDAYEVVGFDEAEGTVTLNFKPARNVEPGKPYLFEWRTTVSGEIQNPVFENVTIKSAEAPELTVTSQDGSVQFVGTYAPETLIPNTTANLYMGNDDKLLIPTDNKEISPFNAYFLVDIGNGLGRPGDSSVKKIVMNISDGDYVVRVISIDMPVAVQDGTWHDLQGRKYVGTPTQSGIYIMDGRKIMIR